MKTDTSKKIVAFIGENKAVTAKALIEYLGISPQAVFRQLKTLIAGGEIEKAGSPPKVFYSLKSGAKNTSEENVGAPLRKLIEQNYLIVTPRGRILRGMAGFVLWCAKNNLPVAKTAAEYAATLRKYAIYKKSGLIDGMRKMRATFARVYLDKLYYLDFYSIERFGKTKLGALLLYAKQSQSGELMKEIYGLIGERIARLIKSAKIDAAGFIPPTVGRKLQFQKEIERLLAIKLPKIKIVKIVSEISVPQKTLSRLEDRIENAGSSIFIDESGVFKNILLIDDAVGSGATFNETAKKIKEKGLCSGKIIGLAITGSFKGFDVLSEV